MNVDDFKPASVDTSQAGSLDVGKGGEVNVSLPNTQVLCFHSFNLLLFHPVCGNSVLLGVTWTNK
jgi:hypothetical protein